MQPPVSQNINSMADYLCNWARQKSSVKAAVCVNRVMSVFLSLNTDSLIWKTGEWRELRMFRIRQNTPGLMKTGQNGLVQNWMFKCDNTNSKKQKEMNSKSAVRKIDVWLGKQKGFYQMHPG